MTCYRQGGGCGPYEMSSCGECPASKPEYAERYRERYNKSSYPDPTAYEAIKRVTRAEKTADTRQVVNKAAFLIRILKYVIRESGFELLGRIELRHAETGLEFR